MYYLFIIYTLQIMTRLKCSHVKQIEFSLEKKYARDKAPRDLLHES